MRWIDSLFRHTACALPVALVTIAALAMPPAQAATITVTTLADAILFRIVPYEVTGKALRP